MQDVILPLSIFLVSLGIALVICSEIAFRVHRFRLTRRLTNVAGYIGSRPEKYSSMVLASRAAAIGDLVLGILVKEGVWPSQISSLRVIGNACGGGIVVWAATLFALNLPWWVGALSAVGALIVIPNVLIRADQKKQCAQFEANLPDTIDMIVRMLRAGLPVTVAIGRVGVEAKEPAAAIYREANEWLEMGLPLAQAMRKVANRIKVKDFDFFSAALAIQSTVGGNLTETLESLSKIIRERSVSFLKARAVTAQARMTANVILGILPGIFVMMLVIRPEYMIPLLDGSNGFGLITFVLLSYMMALFVIRLLVSRVRIS